LYQNAREEETRRFTAMASNSPSSPNSQPNTQSPEQRFSSPSTGLPAEGFALPATSQWQASRVVAVATNSSNGTPVSGKPLLIPRPRERRKTMRELVPPQLLQRLKAGQFTPLRNPDVLVGERRSLTPLAQIKQRIPFQPLVFRDRHEVLIHLAECLNSPGVDAVSLCGVEGDGLHSSLRAFVELLDAQHAELLWFEVPPLTDAPLLARRMLQGLYHLGQQRGLPQADVLDVNTPANWELETTERRTRLFHTLREFLSPMASTPILMVLAGVHELKPPSHVPAFDETLRFLLSLPNIKLLCGGEHALVSEALLLTPHQHIEVELPTLTLPEQYRMFHRNAPAWLMQGLHELQLQHPSQHQSILNQTGTSPALSELYTTLSHGVIQETEALGIEATSVLATLTFSPLPLSLMALQQITLMETTELLAVLKLPLLSVLRFSRPALYTHTLAEDEDALRYGLRSEVIPLLRGGLPEAQVAFALRQLAEFLKSQASVTESRRLLKGSNTVALEQHARRLEALLTNERPTGVLPQQVSLEFQATASKALPFQRTEAPHTNTPPQSITKGAIAHHTKEPVIQVKPHIELLFKLARLQVQMADYKELSNTLTELARYTEAFTAPQALQHQLLEGTLHVGNRYYTSAWRTLLPLLKEATFKEIAMVDKAALLYRLLMVYPHVSEEQQRTPDVQQALVTFVLNTPLEKGDPQQPNPMGALKADIALRWLALHPRLPVPSTRVVLEVAQACSLIAHQWEQSLQISIKLAQAYVDEGNIAQALATLQQAKQLAQQQESLPHMLHLLWEECLLLWQSNELEQALLCLNGLKEGAHHHGEWLARIALLESELALETPSGLQWAKDCITQRLQAGASTCGHVLYNALTQRLAELEGEPEHDDNHKPTRTALPDAGKFASRSPERFTERAKRLGWKPTPT
jgi:tetratricopeptide (TPR) repeat protein